VLAVASNIAPANWSSLPPSIALAAWWRGSPPPRDED